MKYETSKLVKIVRSLWLGSIISFFAQASNSQVITFTPPDPGPPFYTVIEPGFVPHTDEWAAIIFVRQTSCVPPGFNLLTVVNIPAVFGCTLNVEGHAIWRNGPPPIDFVPMQIVLHGTGEVPVWFVSWSELQDAMDDGVLTVAELSGLPSRLVGSASYFKEVQQPGSFRPQGPGNGKIELNATGLLDDGRQFSIEMREMGVNQESRFRHIKISIQ